MAGSFKVVGAGGEYSASGWSVVINFNNEKAAGLKPAVFLPDYFSISVEKVFSECDVLKY